MSRIDNTAPFIPVRIAVLTVSDSRSLETDKSGQTLVDRLCKAGHHLADRIILPDERDQIAAQLRAWIARQDVDVVISTGGTGLTGRDVTVEAHKDVYEKEIQAFGTVFTMISMQKIGTSAVQAARQQACRGEPIYLLCREAPALAAMRGMKFWQSSSIFDIAPAISLKSCQGLMNICAVNRQKLMLPN